MSRLIRVADGVTEAQRVQMRREFEEEYRGIMDQRAVARGRQELEVCLQLVRKADRAQYPQHGTMHLITTRDDVDWACDEAMRALKPERPRNNQTIAGIAMIGGLLFLTWLLFFKGSGGGATQDPALVGRSVTQTALAAMRSNTGTVVITPSQAGRMQTA